MLPPDTQVRAARPEDAEALLSVLCAAFGLSCDAARPLFYGDPYYDLTLKRVLITPEGGLAACLTIIPATFVLGSVPVRVGGIAGVATLPALQGRGYATHLLAETIRAMADELDFSLSALFPYSESYYRRLGWETASVAERWIGTLPPVTNTRLAGSVRPLSESAPDDRPAVHRLHDEAAPEQIGLCHREANRWRVLEMLTQTWKWYVFVVGDRIEGYVVLELPGEEQDAVRVQEMIAASEPARLGLLAFLRQTYGPDRLFTWVTTSAARAAFGLSSPPASLEPVPGMMLRLTNLENALRLLHPVYAPVLAETGKMLTIQAADVQCPANERPLRLTMHGVQPGAFSDSEWVRADIADWAPLYTGHRLPSEAARLGLLHASSASALALADRLFPRRAPFIAPADQF